MVNSTLLTPDYPHVDSYDLSVASSAKEVLYITDHKMHLRNEFYIEGSHFSCVSFDHSLSALDDKKPEAILIAAGFENRYEEIILKLKNYATKQMIPFVLYSNVLEIDAQKMAKKYNFDDYYCGNLTESFLKKIQLITKLKEYKQKGGGLHHIQNYERKLPKVKYWALRRAIDIVVSGGILLILSPLLLVTALIIKLESKGPVFYVSKRAGNNYKIFNFYKFRSMVPDADKQLDKLNNQYKKGAFFKVKNDPRVTKFGAFIRRTSIDEIPQLINVLKGDMSLVGNRPLPLYEAEQLTKDQIALRFLAPAGITGLWQITQRGKDEVTETERILLDLKYARSWSFSYDMKIILGTFPALLQKESV